ncbi:MAG: tripartite tricarboxylate transporter permease, partial [Clostridia bacterium]|nr:tripartite tricarboxylate transporter permease [Clostridia bacterium]
SLFIGGISGGLVSAILTRIPGTPSSVATTWDGYPLTQKGQGVKALGIGIMASFIGTMFSIIVLIFAAPSLARVAIQFGAYEYFAVAVFSITMMASLSEKSMSKGLISGVLGCMFATVGLDPVGSTKRYTFGIRYMLSGFNILPVLVGLFAISEIISYIEKARNAQGFERVEVDLKDIKGMGFTWKEFWGQKWNLLRSAAIGCVIGILPGIGASTSNVMAYTVAKKSSRYPEKFGTGIIDGIVSSEAANNASIGGAMVPLLALGIPGDSVTALLLGGLTLKGISAGPLLFTEHVDLVYSVFIAMIIASVFMLVIEFYGLRGFAKLLGLPKHYMLPAIFLFCVIGAYGVHNNVFDVWTVLLFGAVGFLFSKLDIPASPFILGFIIGPLAEENLRRGLMLSKGSFIPFLQSPLALLFFALAIVSVVASTISHRKRQKKQKG